MKIVWIENGVTFSQWLLNEYACYKGSSVIENCHILTMTVLNEYACYKGSSSDWRQSGLRMIAPNRCAVKMWNEYSAKKEEEKKMVMNSHIEWLVEWMHCKGNDGRY